MKSKLIYIFIALLLPTLVFAQESMLNEKMDDLLARIKQVQKEHPDAERQLQRLLAELNLDMHSPLALRELSRLLRHDAPEELLRRQLQLLSERHGRDHRDRRNESRSSLPVTTADNRPLTSAQQAVIAQVLEDFQVNENVGGCDQYYPAIAVDGGGNFVVVWGDYRNGHADIFAQRYTSSGVAQGANFRVNDDSGSSDQYEPAIAADGSGNVVVVWEDRRNGNADIYAQRYTSSGVKQGANFRVNDDSGSRGQDHPALAVDGGGNFVVVWADYRNADGYIYAQRYSSSGAKQGTNFRVDDDTGTSGQYYPAIAVDGGGNFVVVWYDDRNGNYDIYAQRYSSGGVKQGANFRVNDDTGSSWQYFPAIAVDGGGNFVVVWEDNRNGWYDLDIYAQLFDSQRQRIGSNYRVNNDTGTKNQLRPDVKLVNGHIYTTWQDNRIEGQGYDIFARVDKFNFAPAAPTLSSPQNNSTITTNKPTLTFTVPVDDNHDPLHFKVEISRNSSFTSPITGSPFESKNNPSSFSPTPPLPSGTGTCSFTVPNPLTNGDYWWRVSAWDGTVYGAASEAWKFTIGSAPTATTGAATNVTATSAQLNGTVNANGLTTTVKFQYGTSTSYGSEIAATPGSVSGTSATSVTASLSGLLPNTTYHYRVVATNSLGTTYGTDRAFTTAGLAPTATTGAATNVTATSAQLNGTVNPNRLTTAVKFEYGTSTDYGSEIAGSPSSVSGTSATSVTASLSGLLPNTTYHYRVVATNSLGTTYGEDQSFTTLFIYPSTYTLSHSVNFPWYARGSDYQPTDYRIIGLPGASNAKLTDLIRGVHNTDWQVYWDNGAASDYFVPYDGSDTFRFSVGRAFWLIHKGPWSVTTTVPSAPLNAANQVEIPLQVGWNLITNPFITAMPWAAVQQANGITQPLWSFNGSFASATSFAPYQGYYFDNSAGQLSVLKIPYSGTLAKPFAAEDATGNGWQVQLILTTGADCDSAAWFGVSEHASNGLDALDFRKPRAVGAIPLVYFSRPKWDRVYSIFASDIRSPIEETER